VFAHASHVSKLKQQQQLAGLPAGAVSSQQRAHRIHWGMAEACLEASNTTSEDATKAIDVERTTPDCLNLVLQDVGHLVTTQVSDGCSTKQCAQNRNSSSASGMKE
jgi:hypothetical protein